MFKIHPRFSNECTYLSVPSTLRITFFLTFPKAILWKTFLITLEACSSLAFLIVTISCFGSLNYSNM
jgi:hypothetical protein